MLLLIGIRRLEGGEKLNVKSLSSLKNWHRTSTRRRKFNKKASMLTEWGKVEVENGGKAGKTLYHSS